MRCVSRTLLALALLFVLFHERAAAIPPTINYQAALISGGAPVVIEVDVTFRIYDAATLGNMVWSETRQVTPDSNGRFNLLLGQVSPLSESVFNGGARWLSIEVEGDGEMTARQPLSGAPYAFRVATIDSAAGGTVVGDFRIADAFGVEQVSIVIDPGGPVLSIRDPGGSVTEHTGIASTYYDSASPKAQVSDAGLTLFGATQLDTIARLDNAGKLTSTGVNVQSTAGSFLANKDVNAICSEGPNHNCGENGNNCLGTGFDLNYAANSFAVGGCAQIGRSDLPLVVGSTTIGKFHTVLASGALVAGDSNTVQEGGTNSVAFGYNNRINEVNCFIVGTNNYVGSPQSIAMGKNITVLGGGENFVVGELSHTSNVGDAVIGGGYADTIVNAADAVISGGIRNKIVGSLSSGDLYSVIGGGHMNEINTTTDVTVGDKGSATIAGGNSNRVVSTFGVIAGGIGNQVTASFGVVGGGNYNTASGVESFVGGGDQHTASGVGAVVVGGGSPYTISDRNVASGNASFVGAGRRNYASGDMATVSGGLANEAAGNYSLAAGRRAKANHSGTFVWADDTDADFASTGTDQFLVRAGGGVGINTTSPSSVLQVAGPVATSVATLSSSTTLDASYSVVLVSSSPTTITLPAANGCTGRHLTVKKTDSGASAVTVSANGSDQIDGAASFSLSAQYKYVQLVSDGSNWFVVANN